VQSLFQQANGQTLKAGIVIDTTITGFHYATNFSGTSVYTQHGPADINGSSQPSAFSVTVSTTVTFDQAKKEVLQLLRMSYQNGYKISGLVQKDTIVKGRPVYFVSYTETLDKQNYQNVVFNAVAKDASSVLVFTAGDLDKGKFIEGFKKTLYELDF
jgi:hypothetical protein